MIVGWVNYAGVAMCVHCANDRWNPVMLEKADPIWIDTYGALVACAECKRLINQTHRKEQRRDV